MAAQEFGSRHPAFPSWLHFKDLYGASKTGCHLQATPDIRSKDDSSGRQFLACGSLSRRNFMDDDAKRLETQSVIKRVSGRPGLHGTNVITQVARVPAPVHEAILLGELGSPAGLALVLLDSLLGPRGQMIDFLHRKSSTQQSQARFKLPGRFLRANV